MHKKNEGFTLIELLIAVTIGSMLILAATGSLRMVVRLVESRYERIEANANRQAVCSFFTRQVASLRFHENTNSLFIAREDFVSFVTPLSLYNHYDSGLVIAYYSVKKNRQGLFDLLYGEIKLLPDEEANPFGSYPNISTEAKTEELKLLDSYGRIGFEYLIDLKGDKEGAVSEQAKEKPQTKYTESKGEGKVWEKIGSSGHPSRAIKLSLLKEGAKEEIIAPVMALSLL